MHRRCKMSRGAKVVFLAWALGVLVIATALVYSSLKPRTFSGSEVRLSARSGRYLEVKTTSPIQIEAADSEYFRIVQGETHLYGVPETPPLDYGSDKYFRFDSQLQNGRWEVAEGSSISLELNGEQPFTVTCFPTSGTIADTILVGVLLSFFVWLVGLLLGVMLSYELNN